jgi:hypothetical protein
MVTAQKAVEPGAFHPKKESIIELVEIVQINIEVVNTIGKVIYPWT